MKIKITSPVPELEMQAGLVYEVTEAVGKLLITDEKAIHFEGDAVDVTAYADKYPVSIEAPAKPKKAK